MSIKITGIGKVVTAIVRKRSEAELTKLLPKFKRNLDSRAQYWRTTIRQKLSVMAPKPWGPNTPRNITKWPKMRTGMLRDSILIPKIRWTARLNGGPLMAILQCASQHLTSLEYDLILEEMILAST